MTSTSMLHAFIPKDLEGALEISRRIADSGAVDLDANQVMVLAMAGAKFHLDAISSVRMFYIAEQRICIRADGMAALARRAGVVRYLRLKESSAQAATWVAARADDPDYEFVGTFTIEDAQEAGLLDSPSSLWQRYQADMLSARALSRVCRRAFPDVLSGLYSGDEVDSIDNGDPIPATAPAPQAAIAKMPAPAITHESADHPAKRDDEAQPPPPAAGEADDQPVAPKPSRADARDALIARIRSMCESLGIPMPDTEGLGAIKLKRILKDIGASK